MEYFELVIEDHSDEFLNRVSDSDYQYEPIEESDRYHIGLLKRYSVNHVPLVQVFTGDGESSGFQSKNQLKQFISENRHLRRSNYGLVLTYLNRLDPDNIESPVELTYGKIGIAQRMNRK